jgi:P-type E1-E2 ATPase
MDVFAFDKTGTLTEGQMTVEDSYLIDPQARLLVAALVANQFHPISKAVARSLRVDPDSMAFIKQAVSDVIVVPGKGLESRFAGFSLLGGSAEFAQGEYEPNEKQAVKDGATSVFKVALGGQTIASFQLSDQERPDAKELVQALTSAGKRVVVISGDLEGPVERMANKLGFASENVYGRCSPTRKLEIVRELQRGGQKVCYVGDGANDAAALAASDISIAIGGGADIAQATADIIIGSDRRLKASMVAALRLAKTNRYHVMAAFGWSILYNVFAILLASGAFVTVRIAPQWAGLGELASILPIFIIAFGTRLTWKWGWASNSEVRRAINKI